MAKAGYQLQAVRYNREVRYTKIRTTYEPACLQAQSLHACKPTIPSAQLQCEKLHEHTKICFISDVK